MRFKTLLLPFLVFPFLFACNNDSLKPDFKTEVEKDGFEYSLIGDEIKISGYTGNAKELIFPSHIDGYPVTSIYLQHDISNEINSVVFSEGIKEITFGDYINIKHVSLPSSLTKLNTTFSYAEFNEYENGLYLGNSEDPYIAFFGLKDETVTSCSIKEETKFLREINSETLINLSVPNSVIQIGERFNVPNIKLSEYDNGLYLGNDSNPYRFLMKPKNKDITSLTVHKNTEHIYGSYMAYDDYYTVYPPNINSYGIDFCESLTEVVLPDGLKTIMDYAFTSCKNLKKINFPKSLISIGIAAFSSCMSLESIILPSDMTSIGGSAFKACNGLKEVILPRKIKVIDNQTFEYCSNLESITIPNSVYFIDYCAFNECNSLKEIKLGNKLIAINSSFKELGGLEELIIPNSVKYLFGSFSAKYIKHLKIGSSLTYYRNYNLASTIRELKIGSVSVSKYNKTFDSRKNCDAIIDKKTNEVILGTSSTIIPDNVTSICNNAFSECGTFEHIDIPNSVTKIGAYAFSYCQKIESVFIPASVLEVGCKIFYFIGIDYFGHEEWEFPFSIPLRVYCEATSKPNGWDEDWNVFFSNKRISNVIWGATRDDIPQK